MTVFVNGGEIKQENLNWTVLLSTHLSNTATADGYLHVILFLPI